MKKILTLAMASTFVMGAATTSFAAENPFSDVPAGHWSYDAVQELADAGVVDGYGDGSFRGDRAITRYEMAQIVAKAMAKGANGDEKAALDKLAAEYADELNNLGVRIGNLESKIDNVKFDGYLRMRYTEAKYDGSDATKKYPARLRLNMKAQVNDDWQVKARFQSQYNLDGGADSSFDLKHAYAQGPLFGATAKLGKMPLYSADNGMILDFDGATGAQLNWDGGKLNTTVTAAILDKSLLYYGYAQNNVNYQAAEFKYQLNPKTDLLAAYHHMGTSGTKAEAAGYDSNNIWELGAGYRFDKNFKLSGEYAKSSIDTEMADGNSNAASYTVDLMYKGMKASDKGSFGAYLAYRNLSDKVTYSPTYDGADNVNLKGWEIGTAYALDENITTTLVYFDGKEIGKADNRDYKKIMGEIKFLF